MIVFSLHEITRALIRLHAVRPLFPSMNIMGVRVVESDGKVGAWVSLSDAGSTTVSEAALPIATLAAALIQFCIDQNIPLPKAAQKYLTKAGEGVALHLELHGAVAPIFDVSDAEALPGPAPPIAFRH